MAKKLENKVAIITGADSGIGQATAEEFARHGANVTINYLHDSKGAEETKRRVEAQGKQAVVVQADVRKKADVARLFQETQDRLGTPYILVNNAGVGLAGQTVDNTDTDKWDTVIKTNLYGPFYCCRQFIRARKKAGGKGKIINITSVHEEVPMAGAAGYDAAKGGLRNLTRTLALELAPEKINVNNIAPGMVLTPMNQRAIEDPQYRKKRVQNIPWKRAAEPWEIAKLAVYLASEDADYVTGQSFVIDGGLTINQGQGA